MPSTARDATIDSNQMYPVVRPQTLGMGERTQSTRRAGAAHRVRRRLAGGVLALVALAAGCVEDETVPGAAGQGPPGPKVACEREARTGIEWICLAAGELVVTTETGAPRPIQLPTFEMARTEVTVAQYRLCVAAGACPAPNSGVEQRPICDFGPCFAPEGEVCPECPFFEAHAPWNFGAAGKDQHPVQGLSLEAAQAFARWVGNGARLPTEAEWLYAASGAGQGLRHPWGDQAPNCRRVQAIVSFSDDIDCEGEGFTTGGTAPVCSRARAGNSPQGICDLVGNVSEWVEDDHGPLSSMPQDGRPQRVEPRAPMCPDAFDMSPTSDGASPDLGAGDPDGAAPEGCAPAGEAVPPARVVRGGHWDDLAPQLGGRQADYTGEPSPYIGLRLVR